MSSTFLEANNIKIYAVLSDFSKGCDSHTHKKCAASAQKRGGGASANSGNAHIETVFFGFFLLSGFPNHVYDYIVKVP